jgi:hypothetical protein
MDHKEHISLRHLSQNRDQCQTLVGVAITIWVL